MNCREAVDVYEDERTGLGPGAGGVQGLSAAPGRQRGTLPVIPYRSNRKNIPERLAHALYRGRARIEQMMGKLRRFKRVALRCEKTARNFRSIVALVATFILVKSVHTA